jgi:predicted enzyme related to lactoylglutathione lyase
MPTMRFNHMELTFPPGTLTTEFREEVDAFYSDVFGWIGVDTEVVGQLCHILLSEEAQQFILLAESDKPMSSPGYDHLGLLFATRQEVDEKLEQVKRYQEKDDRVKIKEYDDLVTGDITTRAFYVKYLLPIYFDVQALERAGTPVPNTLA